MAAFRRIVGGSNPSLSYASLLPPALLISRRGFTSKLFVGGTTLSLLHFLFLLNELQNDSMLVEFFAKINKIF